MYCTRRNTRDSAHCFLLSRLLDDRLGWVSGILTDRPPDRRRREDRAHHVEYADEDCVGSSKTHSIVE